MEQILTTPLWEGRTLGELLTLEFLVGLAGNVLSAIAILIFGWIFAGWINRRVTAIPRRYPRLDLTLFNFFGNVLWYVVIAFAVLFVLNSFGVQTTSIVALIGAAGLAIGLALQGTLSNIAAGVMIILFRPIKVGDFVVVNGQMGGVTGISLNYTELANLQNIQIIIPNSQVWGNTIVNYSINQTRRVEWTFAVSYGANLKLAEETIRQTIMGDPRAHAEPEPFIQVAALGEFSVDFLVRVWCSNDDAFNFETDMKRAVKEAFDREGIEIPFPTRTVFGAPAEPLKSLARGGQS